jgi:hypothetical protein
VRIDLQYERLLESCEELFADRPDTEDVVVTDLESAGSEEAGQVGRVGLAVFAGEFEL